MNERLREMGTSPLPPHPTLPQTTTRVGPFHSAVIYLSLYKPTVSLKWTFSAGPNTLHWFRYLPNSAKGVTNSTSSEIGCYRPNSICFERVDGISIVPVIIRSGG